MNRIPCKEIRIPVSEKFLLVESGIQENFACGIRNPNSSPGLFLRKTWEKPWGRSCHDVTAAILMSQNNETEAMLVFQINPVGVELFSSVKTFFCSAKFA